MDTIWTIMAWIVYGIEVITIVGLMLGFMIIVSEPEMNEQVDKIRNYILMRDDEDFN